MLNPKLRTTHKEHNEKDESTVPQVLHYSWDGDIAHFMEYVSTLDDGKSYEGIWDIGGNYKIGIIREGSSYIGFIIESTFEEWLPNMIKLRIDLDGDDVVSTFYLRDFSPEVSVAPSLLRYKYIRMGNRFIKRLQPSFPDDPLIESYARSLLSTEPYFEMINENTLYFKLPSFPMDTTQLDEIIKENINRITSTRNLIIDLRNNGGGRDNLPLFEYLYTNPIASSAASDFLATEKNNQIIYNQSQGITLMGVQMGEVHKQFAADVYEQIKDRVGEFVRFPFGPEKITLEKVYQYPRHVAIITNKGSMSAAEHYTLMAKQSTKVKVFGEPTFGIMDTMFIGDSMVESPCGEIWLQFTNARFSYVPGLVFDGIGIQPDFFIDSSVPDYSWVKHVSEIMSNWVSEPKSTRRRKQR